jgi:hypothetical protein
MRTFNKQIASGVVLDQNRNGDYIQLKNIYMYSLNAIVTGVPTGTIKLQASNDPETNDTQYNVTAQQPPAVGPSNWVDIADSSFNLTSAGSTMWNVSEVAYNYVRVVYIDTSGGTSTAEMKIIFNGKGV